VGIGTTTPTDKLQVNGDVRVGVYKDLPGGAVEPEGWGNVIHFSGGPDVSPVFNSDNSDGFYIGRYNIASDLSEVRIRLGDNLGTANNDAFVIGSRSQTLPWTPYFRVQSNGFTGIGENPTTYPTNQLHVIANTNPLRLEGLQQGAATDSILTVNNTGVVRQSVNPMPAGSIISFAGAAAPAGFLICDGSAVSRTTYADLFAVIATTYGVGNGTTTFNIPDLRGEFIRGADAGKGSDPGRVLGSNQIASPVVGDDCCGENDFSMEVGAGGTTPQFFDNYDASYNGVNFWYSTSLNAYNVKPTNGAGFLRGSRPRNVALNYIIRY
jgi:microcystin-dependent protein